MWIPVFKNSTFFFCSLSLAWVSYNSLKVDMSYLRSFLSILSCFSFSSFFLSSCSILIWTTISTSMFRSIKSSTFIFWEIFCKIPRCSLSFWLINSMRVVISILFYPSKQSFECYEWLSSLKKGSLLIISSSLSIGVQSEMNFSSNNASDVNLLK